MAYKVKTAGFEGPFDLLLHLVSRQKLSVNSISIIEVTDQYLEHIERLRELDLDVASDFLLVAATLLEIKAASLLPAEESTYIGDELDDLAPEDARELLVARLLTYKQFKNVAGELSARMESESRMHPRQAGIEEGFVKLMPDFLEGITLHGLAVICADLIHKRQVFLLEAEHVASMPIPLELHAESVARRLKREGRLTLSEFLGENPYGRTDRRDLPCDSRVVQARHGRSAAGPAVRRDHHYVARSRHRVRPIRGGCIVSTSSDLRGAIEALLFVSDEPVSASRMARVLESSEASVDGVLKELAEEYQDQERGFQLREVAGGWRMFTHPAYHEKVEQYVLSWDTRRLSQASLEALAVIAYHQPVTRAGVNAVRGVNSEGVISSLVDKGLVREVGRDKNQGNAILYGTTRTFLEKFGLPDIAELPPLEEFAPDPQTERAIRERLGALDGSSLADEIADAEDRADEESGVSAAEEDLEDSDDESDE